MPARRSLLFSITALFAALLLCTFAHAQDYSFRHFGTTDGLGNLTILKIYQDRSGFIWVSTENGLFRYDGERFETVGQANGIPAEDGVAFGEAPDGSLLIGGSFGLYHQIGSRFEQFKGPFKTVIWGQGIERDSQGHTYVATETGLYTLTLTPTGPTFNRIYPAPGAPAENVRSIYPDGNTLWFGCESLLCHLDAGKLTKFGPESGLPDTSFVAILRDSSGNLWVRARTRGILELPAGQTHFRYPDTPVPGLALSGPPAKDRSGHVLLGTPDAMLLQTPHGWQTIDHRSGLRGGIFALFEDRQHNLWIGSGGRGLSVWHGYHQWESYSSTSGLPADNIYEILPQPDGSVYVAAEGGLSLGTPHDSTYTFTTIPGTKGTPVHSLQRTATGDLLLGTAGHGIALLHPATNQLSWITPAQGLTGKLTLTLRLDNQQTLWAASEVGIFTSAAPYTTFTHITELPSAWFWTVAPASDGTIWAGALDGLFVRSAGQWHHFKTDSGLANNAVTAILPAPDGSAWIGYQHGGGIDRVRLTSTGTLSVQHHLERPGTNGLIYFLSYDHAGRLWAGTERGVDVLDNNHWAHFDTTDGLVWDDLDLNGFTSTPDGTLWFGTAGGLSIFKPSPLVSDKVPNVLFTDIHLGDADVLSLKNPTFPFGSGSLVAHFAAPEATQDSSLLFRYRLDQGPWIETTQRQLEFASLAPHSYRLQVQTRDNAGLWSPNTATYQFTIQPPWYRRWWFVALLFCLPFLIAAITYRIRSYAGRAREQRLRRLVDARTTELSAANEELTRLTLQDALTGLANRRRFDQAIAVECDRVVRSAAVVSLILIDADHFKPLNDTWGHQKGDEYLITLARELMSVARRKIEVAARIGGEEFALLLPATTTAEAVRIAEAVRRRIQSLALPHPTSPSGVLTVSIGVSTAHPAHHCTAESLVAEADQALYRAKSLGRNRVEVA